ncbi:unnamed protein product [Oppiella nova]|uniref:Uncharacterized protein n=1 Tax=Oppiella nova TaxID=334625 RepID=A0A7R9QHP7_9ACAR|nr:unnamed protein product [Oppiella nova]CAG2165231.1 unnamed protein product [Oppiella nova]
MFVKSIGVNIGQYNNQGCLPQDINKGFKGEYVWLRPEYTTNKRKAATGFHIMISGERLYDANDVHHRDLAIGAGGQYRYLIAEYNGPNKITTVWLSEDKQGCGSTGDINAGRGGRYLYLCWSY